MDYLERAADRMLNDRPDGVKIIPLGCLKW